MVRTALRVAMICTGNICRSPMAEVVLATSSTTTRCFVVASTSRAPAPRTGTSGAPWTTSSTRARPGGLHRKAVARPPSLIERTWTLTTSSSR